MQDSLKNIIYGSAISNDAAPGQYHRAIQEKSISKLMDLIDKGANVNDSDENETTPLMFAATRDFLPGVQALIKAGAQLGVRNSSGETPLTCAVKSNNLDIVSLLLSLNALTYEDSTEDSTFHWSPLMHASFRGHVEAARLLLEAGACPNAQTQSKTSALELAADELREDVLELLIQYGANVNIDSGDGATPLINTMRHGNRPGFDLLLRHGAAQSREHFDMALKFADKYQQPEYSAALRALQAMDFARQAMTQLQGREAAP